MAKFKSIAVFCGSSKGKNKVYEQAAYTLGATMAKRGLRVVYGGSKIGLMGAVADGALAHKGEVLGVLPHFLNTREIAHDKITELYRTNSMHERKTKMHELSDAVIALPGGFGTLEELFEMITWAQLGLHQKPIGLLNVNGYYDHLQSFCRRAIEQGFVHSKNESLLLFASTIDDLLQKMQDFVAPPSDLDLRLEET